MGQGDFKERGLKKVHGVFYTPELVSTYILKRTILAYLSKDLQNPAQSIQLLLKEYSSDSTEVSLLVDRIKSIRLLDPSCGDGIFLIGALDLLLKIWAQINLITNTELNQEFIIKEIIKNNLFGVDILPDAIQNLKKKLLSKISDQNFDMKSLNSNFKIGDALRNDKFNWIKEFPNVFSEGGFNVIVGNPPWGGIISPPYNYYAENYETFNEPPESFALFIEAVISRLLRKNGYFSFIIPNEICFNQAFVKLRKYLMEKTWILELTNLGEGVFNEVTRPSLIFFIQNNTVDLNQFNKIKIKIKTNFLRESNDSKDFPNELLGKFQEYFRTYESFYKNEGFRWDIHRTEEDSILLKKVRQNPNILKLKEIVYNGRGFDFNKDGTYILCYNCGNGNTYYGKGNSSSGDTKKEKFCISCNTPLPKSLIKGMREFDASKKAIGELRCAFKHEKKGPNDRLVLVGEDIQRLYIQKPSRYIDPTENELRFLNFRLDKQLENHLLYTGERILVRKVSKLLCLSVCDEDCLCNDQVYVWKKKPKFSKYSHYYLAAIMISKFQYYHYILETGNIEKIAYPHFRQEDIKNFLIPQINFSDKNEVQKHDSIINNMKELINLVEKYHGNDFETKRNNNDYVTLIFQKENELNNMVCELLNVDSDFINHRVAELNYVNFVGK